MIQVSNDLFIIDKLHSLVFSEADEDDSGKGWYIQKEFPKPIWSKTSQLFATKAEALKALKDDQLIYD